MTAPVCMYGRQASREADLAEWENQVTCVFSLHLHDRLNSITLASTPQSDAPLSTKCTFDATA